MRLSVIANLLGVVVLLAGPPAIADEPAKPGTAPLFELPKWETSQTIKLTDYAGQIVVLDFFAYWCVPCRQASAEIEATIQKFYASHGGNPQGVPVRVLSINIEKDRPAQTDRFIKDTCVKTVLNDFGGALLDKLGGLATPHIVVIDGTHATAHAPDFRVLYNHSGYEGTRKLHKIIDAIKPPKEPRRSAGRKALDIEHATGPPVTRTGDFSSEALLSDDIQTTTTMLSFDQNRGGTDWKVSIAYDSIDLDYEPFRLFDFLGFAECVHQNRVGGQFSVRQRLSDTLTLNAVGGGYTGFTDFRSAWLATYYQQQYSFVPGYHEPDPKGMNAAAGLRWEYRPTLGFAEATFSYAYDEVAPGWDFDPAAGGLSHGRENLHTYAPSLRFENVLTSHVRMLNEFQLTSTSGRELRFGYRGSLNIALGENWVCRLVGGYTSEDPTLRAWFVNANLDYEITPAWLIGVSGRYYHDTGEIENGLLISTAAPGLETAQGGLSLRHVGSRVSFMASVAPVFANYQAPAVGTMPFANLYRDRTWILAQLSCAVAL